MSDYNDARNFFDAFMGCTWQYSTDVKLSLQGTANNLWEYISKKNNPSELKRAFINKMKESAEVFENEGYGIHIRIANAIREILDEIIPQYMDDDEEDEEPLDHSNDELSFDIDSIREKAKSYDIDLSGQFVVESMTGEVDYSPKGIFSDIEKESIVQEQYSHFCLMAKSNLVMDSMGGSLMNPMMKMFKDYLLAYISNPKNREHDGMKHFYDLNDDDLIIHQISMFSFMANMKNVEDIHNVTVKDLQNAFNPESVALALGMYTYFSIMVNKNYEPKDFNKLFVEGWVDYYNNFKVRYIMLKMNGNNWKDEFKGALLSD